MTSYLDPASNAIQPDSARLGRFDAFLPLGIFAAQFEQLIEQLRLCPVDLYIAEIFRDQYCDVTQNLAVSDDFSTNNLPPLKTSSV